MQGRNLWLAIAVVAAVVAGGIVLAGMALGGGDDESSVQQYQVVVVEARDRVDFSLGRLSKAQSLDELLERMDEGAAAIGGAASELDDTTPPDELADVHEQLAENMHALSDDIQGTADQARVPGFEGILLGADGLNFDSWDAINANLEAMQEQGVVVQPLARKTTD
jgi:hypothetical protein